MDITCFWEFVLAVTRSGLHLVCSVSLKDSAGVRSKNSSALEKAFDTAVVEAREIFEKRRIEKAVYASKMSEKLLQVLISIYLWQ